MTLEKIDLSIVDSILFNCSQPEVMEAAIITTSNFISGKAKIGVYANAFPAINSSQKEANNQIRKIRSDLTPSGYLFLLKNGKKLARVLLAVAVG